MVLDDDDHTKAQAMVEDTGLLCQLIAAASPAAVRRPSGLMSLRVLGGYVIGLRDLCYGMADIEGCVRLSSITRRRTRRNLAPALTEGIRVRTRRWSRRVRTRYSRAVRR
jgi:hypothetical protein